MYRFDIHVLYSIYPWCFSGLNMARQIGHLGNRDTSWFIQLWIQGLWNKCKHSISTTRACVSHKCSIQMMQLSLRASGRWYCCLYRTEIRAQVTASCDSSRVEAYISASTAIIHITSCWPNSSRLGYFLPDTRRVHSVPHLLKFLHTSINISIFPVAACRRNSRTQSDQLKIRTNRMGKNSSEKSRDRKAQVANKHKPTRMTKTSMIRYRVMLYDSSHGVDAQNSFAWHVVIFVCRKLAITDDSIFFVLFERAVGTSIYNIRNGATDFLAFARPKNKKHLQCIRYEQFLIFSMIWNIFTDTHSLNEEGSAECNTIWFILSVKAFGWFSQLRFTLFKSSA